MKGLQRLCRRALCAPIRAYKRYISPGLGYNCRFTPTCSEYAIQAIETHGCLKGAVLAVWRILRCNPMGKWGFDPVPEPGQWRSPKRILHPAEGFSTKERGSGGKPGRED